MKYNSFENEIHALILERGKTYFTSGSVNELKETSDGWHAVIKGQEHYKVLISTNDDEITDWNCSCPYDHGPICKHVTAVLYAITDSSQKSLDAAVHAMGQINDHELRVGLKMLLEKSPDFRALFMEHVVPDRNKSEEQ
jgi:uncharacterized Zn finger protein